MDLNNIELSDLLIAELYRDTLIASPSAPAAPMQSAATSAAPTPTSPTTTPAGKGPSVSSPRSTAPPQAAATSAPHTTAPQASSAATSAAASPQASPAGTAPTPGLYKFLGGNQKKITVLVHSAGIGFLPDDQLNILTRMLEACKMNLSDVAIVNHATVTVNIVSLKEQLAPRIILLFGIEPVAIQLPINFPQFKIQSYDQCSYLSAPSLDQMTAPTETSKAIKSKLWTCLKTLFSV